MSVQRTINDLYEQLSESLDLQKQMLQSLLRLESRQVTQPAAPVPDEKFENVKKAMLQWLIYANQPQSSSSDNFVIPFQDSKGAAIETPARSHENVEARPILDETVESLQVQTRRRGWKPKVKTPDNNNVSSAHKALQYDTQKATHSLQGRPRAIKKVTPSVKANLQTTSQRRRGEKSNVRDKFTTNIKALSLIAATSNTKRDIERTPLNAIKSKGVLKARDRINAMIATLISSRDQQGKQYSPKDARVTDSAKALRDCSKRVVTHLLKYLVDLKKIVPSPVNGTIKVQWQSLNEDIKNRYLTFFELKAYEECGLELGRCIDLWGARVILQISSNVVAFASKEKLMQAYVKFEKMYRDLDDLNNAATKYEVKDHDAQHESNAFFTKLGAIDDEASNANNEGNHFIAENHANNTSCSIAITPKRVPLIIPAADVDDDDNDDNDDNDSLFSYDEGIEEEDKHLSPGDKRKSYYDGGSQDLYYTENNNKRKKRTGMQIFGNIYPK